MVFLSTGYLIGHLEAIQRRVLRAIFPHCKYSDALTMANIPTIEHRLYASTMSYFKQMAMENKEHQLNYLFPQLYQNQHSTRYQAIDAQSKSHQHAVTKLPTPLSLKLVDIIMQVRDFEAMKGIDYEETNTYRAFLPFDTPIRKIGFCPERDSNPRLPDY